jgi:hypothetical protein
VSCFETKLRNFAVHSEQGERLYATNLINSTELFLRNRL